MSIGTGISLTYFKDKSLDLGYGQWVKPLINVLMDGVSGIANYQAQQLLSDKYHRLHIVFDQDDKIEMDAVKKLGLVNEIGVSHSINQTVLWIKEAWV